MHGSVRKMLRQDDLSLRLLMIRTCQISPSFEFYPVAGA